MTSTFVSCFRNTSLPENICIRKVKEQITWFSGEEFVQRACGRSVLSAHMRLVGGDDERWIPQQEMRSERQREADDETLFWEFFGGFEQRTKRFQFTGPLFHLPGMECTGMRQLEHPEEDIGAVQVSAASRGWAGSGQTRKRDSAC